MTPRRRVVDVPALAHRSPLPVGVRVGRLLVSSAITGRDDRTGAYPEDPAVQAENAFRRLRLFLAAAGATTADVLQVRVYARAVADRRHLDPAWMVTFPDPTDRPARHVVVTDVAQFHPLLRFQLEVTVVLPGPVRRAERRLRRLVGAVRR